ncbi:G-type lectin S-receptor-like serine/threonine-protein kinase LECRK3 [Neltuma alba]|uniref:G-type lectin S-receptor-like serine/threonine-protein kinase LECRK3 n=1 Tax=Neltuma alba TaxID=207710 RepID=UPI0010A41E28|nr:G-type lectin S-receptor-like serine/threonine-protein kinase LECRK3 [Prosopis alba]
MVISLNPLLLCALLLFPPPTCVFAQTRFTHCSRQQIHMGAFTFWRFCLWISTTERIIILSCPSSGMLRLQTQPLAANLYGTVLHGPLNDFSSSVLKDRSLNSVWDNFKDPTDTILLSQILGRGGVLSTRKSETDFAGAKFQLVLQDYGNLVMHSISLPSGYPNENYFETYIVESETSSPSIELVFNKSGELHVLRENNDTYTFSTSSPNQFYVGVTLDYDGVFRFYRHPKNSYCNETYITLWSWPDNICHALVSEGTSVCGYNSICSSVDNNRQVCRCLEGYSPIDPQNPYDNSKPDFINSKEDESSQKK